MAGNSVWSTVDPEANFAFFARDIAVYRHLIDGKDHFLVFDNVDEHFIAEVTTDRGANMIEVLRVLLEHPEV